MSISQRKPVFWALLVGINKYPEYNNHNNNLSGCITDVEKVQKWIEENYPQSMELKIRKIIWPIQDWQNLDPPSYENITNALNEISDAAQKGDMFQFHYSGHGSTQDKSKDPNHPEKIRDGDKYEVLVLQGDRMLKDYELGRHLDGIAKKGVRTVAILDCCHSGGGDRLENNRHRVRGIPTAFPADGYDLENPPPNPDNEIGGGSRSATTKPSYWNRARDYTLIAACQPAQVAMETPPLSPLEGQLTKTILDSDTSLRGLGQLPTYKTLFWDVYANMPRGVRQEPMIYGEQDFVLFSFNQQSSDRPAVVDDLDVECDNLTGLISVSTGAVHGVRVGDVYAIHPRRAWDLSQTIARIRIVSIVAAHAFGLQLPHMAGEDIQGNAAIVEKGCPVSLVTSADILRVQVEDANLRQELQLNETAKLQFTDGQQEVKYRVAFRDSVYRIEELDGTQLRNSPVFSPNNNPHSLATDILRFLQKVTHYLMVENIYNPLCDPNNELSLDNDANLDNQFSFWERNGRTTVAHGGKANLGLKNLNPVPHPLDLPDTGVLYYCIVNLCPTNWTVEVTVPREGEGFESLHVRPQVLRSYDPDMSIPETTTEFQSDDIFKVIISTEPFGVRQLSTDNLIGRGIAEGPQNFIDILAGGGGARTGRCPPVRIPDWHTKSLTITVTRNT